MGNNYCGCNKSNLVEREMTFQRTQIKDSRQTTIYSVFLTLIAKQKKQLFTLKASNERLEIECLYENVQSLYNKLGAYSEVKTGLNDHLIVIGPVSFNNDTLYYGTYNPILRVKEGQGILRQTDGSVYEGSFQKDLPQGQGRQLFPNGDYYLGSFHQGLFNGKGKIELASGVIYEGYWQAGKKQGFGEQKYPDGSLYKGN